jgi:hypothetical protein
VQIGAAIVNQLTQTTYEGSRSPFVDGLLMAWLGCIFLAIYSPLAAIYLVPYRVVARVVGRPRFLAYALACLAALGLWAFSPSRDPLALVAATAILLGYAAIVPLPGVGLEAFPTLVRAAMFGILLSLIFYVGSLAAVVWALRKAARGAWIEAGVIATAATAVPSLGLLGDLFRDDVPSENYLATGLMLLGTAFGLGALVVGFWHDRRRAPDAPTRIATDL